MPLDEKQKVKLLKKRGAEWYVDAVNELKKKNEEKKPGGANAEILQD